MKAIDTKRSDFKPDFGYKQSKTKKECSNPEFHNKNIHRIAIMKKEHFGSKGDRDERGLPGWTAYGICMGCGKKFTVYAFYLDSEWYQEGQCYCDQARKEAVSD